MSEPGTSTEDGLDFYELNLYVAGQTPKSIAAFENLHRVCEEYLPGRYTINIIDLLKHPELAREHQILALPTLIRRVPQPIRKLIGDLSNTEKTLVGMDIKARKE